MSTRGSRKCSWKRWASRRTTSIPPRPCKGIWGGVDRLPGHHVPPQARIQDQDPARELFPDPISPDDPVFVRDNRLTDEYLTAPRPHAVRQPRDLEHDRQLNRINDLVTVELLMSYVRWKLAADGKANSDVPAQSL